MKEQIHTIPISDAMENAGECPFCYIERRTEEHVMNYVLGPGASYMEPDIRAMTDKEGFCRNHLRKMYIYGNALGNAWIMKTLSNSYLQEMRKEFAAFKPDLPAKKGGLFAKKTASANSIIDWIDKRDASCFTCTMINNTFNAYMKTFFSLYKKEPEFRAKLSGTQGFCIDHFRILLENADEALTEKERKEFYAQILPLMEQNFARVQDDVSWFIERYNNHPDAENHNYKGSIQRVMQKLHGGDPSLPDIKQKK